jgi:zinc transport system substrate-binding protein
MLPLLVLVLFAASWMPAHAAEVLVSIKPLHSLVAGVMAGVGKPELLVRGAASPHTYSLKPSDARRLATARLIFWIGPNFETFLEKPLSALAGNARVVTFATAPEVMVLPNRRSGDWERNDDEPRLRENGAHGVLGEDGHIWLDPVNAKAIVAIIAHALADIDPGNALRYHANAAAVTERLDGLDAELASRLSGVTRKPFVVFHDAYQYFEHRYGLDAIGSITVAAESLPGARRLADLRNKIRSLHARCIFGEPQFQPELVRTLVAETDARSGVLDPLGVELTAGPDLYFKMMRRLAAAVVECLK